MASGRDDDSEPIQAQRASSEHVASKTRVVADIIESRCEFFNDMRRTEAQDNDSVPRDAAMTFNATLHADGVVWSVFYVASAD